jgi:lysylphosphatidylglycerol synthetase-like protein (DUF2156 family)
MERREGRVVVAGDPISSPEVERHTTLVQQFLDAARCEGNQVILVLTVCFQILFLYSYLLI